MKTETVYICEYCGLAFDNYEECYAHETEEGAKKLKGVKFFDDNGNRLSLSIDPGRIYYFELTTETAKAIDKYFENHGYYPPSREVDTGLGGQFYWDNDEWHNVDELRERLTEIEKVFKEKE